MDSFTLSNHSFFHQITKLFPHIFIMSFVLWVCL